MNNINELNGLSYTAIIYNKAEKKYTKYYDLTQWQLAALCCDENVLLLLVATNGLAESISSEIETLS